MYIYNLALVVGASLLVILMIINLIITAASSNAKFLIYIPAGVVFAAGLVMLVIASATKVEVMGLGLGGWGGASLFAAALTMIATSTIEAYRRLPS